jgi:hypothetical protein
MAEINDWMTKRRGVPGYQINISVPADKGQKLADALDTLKRRNITSSKSALIVRAVIEMAEEDA